MTMVALVKFFQLKENFLEHFFSRSHILDILNFLISANENDSNRIIRHNRIGQLHVVSF